MSGICWEVMLRGMCYPYGKFLQYQVSYAKIFLPEFVIVSSLRRSRRTSQEQSGSISIVSFNRFKITDKVQQYHLF